MSDTNQPTGAAGVTERSLLARIALTPLTDVLRGRLSCRLDSAAVFERAGLPGVLVEQIQAVARKTRLWRSERVEVTAELAAHFADGLEAGRSPDELIKSFGDPARAALLIRRAKKRTRPLIWRAWARAWQALGLLLATMVLVYGVLTVRFFTGSPKITHNYTTELNAPLASIPDDQKGWPLYRRAVLLAPEFPDAIAKSWPEARPGTPEWEWTVRYIERCREYLDLSRQASRRPYLGRPLSAVGDPEVEQHLIDISPKPQGPGKPPKSSPAPVPTGAEAENPMMFSILLPEMGLLRNIARHLAFDARVAATGGDADRAFSDYKAIFSVAEHASQNRLLIGELVGLAVFNLGLQKLGETLDEHPALFSDRQLIDLIHTVGAWHGGGTLQISLAIERVGFDDVLQRLFTDDGSGDGRLTPQGARLLSGLMSPSPVGFSAEDSGTMIAAPVGAAILASRTQQRAMYNRLLDAAEAQARLPLWQREGFPGESEVEALVDSSVGRARYMLISILMPALGRATIAAELATQTRDAMLVTIALEMYKRQNGRYPASLDELVPSFLPTVPPDRFDGGPIRYRLVSGRPVVYSVGSDRKDDGGRPPKAANLNASRWYSASQIAVSAANSQGSYPFDVGDWVFWPPVQYDPQSGDLIESPAK